MVARNNTLYRNQKTPIINDGELSAYDAANVRFVNNIVYASPDRKANGAGNATNVVFENNLYFGASTVPVTSPSDIVGRDPLFVNPTLDLGTANFAVRAGSPAIDTALAAQSPATDIAGTRRPVGAGPDLGAWEYVG